MPLQPDRCSLGRRYEQSGQAATPPRPVARLPQPAGLGGGRMTSSIVTCQINACAEWSAKAGMPLFETIQERPMSRLLTVVSALAVFLSPALAHGSEWTIDGSHSSAQFAVRHFMVSTVRGTFGTLDGSVSLDEQDIARSSVRAEIDVASIDTREAKRDEHLRGADFFEVDKHPTMRFVSTTIERLDTTHYRLTGELTIKGRTHQVVFAVEGSATPITDPWGKQRLGGVATATINRTDFGLNYNAVLEAGGLTIGEEVQITIDFELVRQ